MKTRILIVAIIIISGLMTVSFGTNAQNKNTMVYDNIISNDGTGIMKEYIHVDKKTNQASDRKIYKYNNEGSLTEIICYKWNSISGWMPLKKWEYRYSGNLLLSILHTEWNGISSKWSDKSEYTVYNYNNDGSLLSVELHNVNRIKNILHAELIR